MRIRILSALLFVFVSTPTLNAETTVIKAEAMLDVREG